MQYIHQMQNTCAKAVIIDIEHGIIENVKFINGCDGNLKSIGLLVKGQDALHIAQTLNGVICAGRPTSCGDQLSKGLLLALAAESESIA